MICIHCKDDWKIVFRKSPYDFLMYMSMDRQIHWILLTYGVYHDTIEI